MHGDPQQLHLMSSNPESSTDSAIFGSILMSQNIGTEKTWLNCPVAEKAWLDHPCLTILYRLHCYLFSIVLASAD